MPLKLIPPGKRKGPNWTIRGTHLGVYVEESTRTPSEALARKALAAKRQQIERDLFSPEPIKRGATGPTFLEAAVAYLDAGGEGRFLGRYDEKTGQWSGIIAHFGEILISEITPAAIHDAAVKLAPRSSPQTRNRQIYTPVSAVLKAAGVEMTIKRPKGWRGIKRVDWLQPKQAFALFKAADAKDAEFGIFLRTLLYTGMRLSECTGMTLDRLELGESFAYVPTTKNGQPRGVHLPPVVVAALANHPRGLERPGDRVFRFRKCGRLYTWLDEVFEAAGIIIPERTGFHILRHTWATWMRRYGGLDVRGLVGTGAWTDEKSAARYAHVVTTEEARRADRLPTERDRGKSGKFMQKQAKKLKCND
ncbi:site-specific integrase [Candidatus Parcubacteria bacterium]|nr:MAG: site-specific integrase [Candidatus Parcubacteria bacterium]